jgi:N-alpha-acetyl-L-2,4-diaminobutyrate deacetylase
VAGINLARELQPEQVSGRVIVIPCVSTEASLAFTRCWPSGANMNRSFPGSPQGREDEQLAHFISTALFPISDLVVDIHSGGRTSLCVPWSEMLWVDDPEQRRQMVDGMYAWNADWCCVYVCTSGSGLLVEEAGRQGKIVVSTEMGGGGHVTAAIHRLTASGLRNVLRRFGVIEGDFVTRAQLGLPEQTLLRATEPENFMVAPESGMFEVLVDLGQRVAVDEPVGLLHFLERPDREPEVILSRTSGIVCCIRSIATSAQSDTLVWVAHEVDRAELA